MKYLLLLVFSLFTVVVQSQTAIQEFDAVMEAYNLAYTSTDDPKEQAEIDAKYELLISEAESVLEEALENEIKEQEEILLKEQQESETEIEKLEAEADKETDVQELNLNKDLLITMYKEGVSNKNISSAFKEEDLIDLGEDFGFDWTTKGSKISKVNTLVDAMRLKGYID